MQDAPGHAPRTLNPEPSAPAPVSKGLLAGVSLEEMKARISRDPYRPYWERLTARWREIAAWEAETGEVRYIGSCAGAQITWLVREAALEYRLTGNPDALAYVARQIDKLADVYLHRPEEWKKAHGRIHPYWSKADVALAVDLCRDGLDAARMATFLRLAREHLVEAPYIGWDSATRYLGGHNMSVTEQACAGICALVWGADCGRGDWEAIVERAIDSCRAYARNGLDRSGYGYEGTMYAVIPVETIYLLAQILLQNGRENLFESIPELSAAPTALRSLLFPDRTALVPLADGGIASPKSFAWLLLAARHFGRPEDLAFWYEFRGPGRAADPCANNNPPPLWPKGSERGPARRDGWGQDLFPFLWWDAAAPVTPLDVSPQPTAGCSHGTEVAAFRTSWGRDAVHVVVSGQGRGHASLDHAHSDAGHFTMFAHGEYLAIDTGYWNVYEDQHSVVLIDGQGPFNRTGDERYRKHYAGRLEGFQRHALLDYVRADAAHPRNCVWADRHVLFVRTGGDGAYLVAIDNINPDHRAHTYQWQLQAHPESTVRVTGDTTASVERAKSRIDVAFIPPLPTDFTGSPYPLTLQSEHVYGAYVQGHAAGLKGAAGLIRDYIYTEDEARRETTDLTYSSWYHPRLTAEFTGPVGLLMSVLSPRRAGEPARPVRRASGHRVFRAEVDCGAFTDTIIAALDHGLIRMPDVAGTTELALIRRDRSGRVMDHWTVDGSPLTFT